MVDKILGKTETSFIYFNVLIFYKTMKFYKTVIFLIYFNTFYIRMTLQRRGWLRSDAQLLFFCFVFVFTNTGHPDV